MNLDLLKDFGLHIGYLLAGTLAGIIRVFYTGEKNWLKGTAMVLAGAITTSYITPAVVEKLSLSQHASYGVAFIVGLLAMYIVGGLISMGKAFAASPTESIKNLLNLKK